MSSPNDIELMQKLQFILNSEIQPVLATRDQIIIRRMQRADYQGSGQSRLHGHPGVMKDERHKLAASSWRLVLLLLVLYPLSIGPADCILALCSGHPRFGAGLHAAYYPVSSICGKSATLTTLLGHYVVLWHRAVRDPLR